MTINARVEYEKEMIAQKGISSPPFCSGKALLTPDPEMFYNKGYARFLKYLKQMIQISTRGRSSIKQVLI